MPDSTLMHVVGRVEAEAAPEEVDLRRVSTDLVAPVTGLAR